MKNRTEHDLSKTLYKRRNILFGLGGVAALTCLRPFIFNSHSVKNNMTVVPRDSEIWISAQGGERASYGFGWVNAHQVTAKNLHTGLRGHGLVQHPIDTQIVVMITRRPGTVGVVLDVVSGLLLTTFNVPNGRQFEGHACFSADGKQLFTTESDIKTGAGKIGIYDSVSFKRVGEWNSFGIGPHEIKAMPGAHVLVVANGGLHKPPGSETPINIDSMQSSLTYIHMLTGELISEHRLAESKASLRHVDIADDGTVAVAAQVQRKAMNNNRVVALGAIHKEGGELMALTKPEPVIAQLRDYMGSVAVNSASRMAGFTSPRGNIATFWHMDGEQNFVGYHAFNDVCGITVSADKRYFVLSNSAGQIRQLDAHTLVENRDGRMSFADMRWDNHMVSIRV